MNAKKVLSMTLAAAMVFGASAMAAGSEAKAEGVTLEFQQWWEPELPDGVLREICDVFTEETGISIELLSNPYAETKTQIAAGAATGTMADVVGLDGAWVYDFAKQQSITNLSVLMEEDGYDTSQLSDQVQVDGGTYMIPVVNFAMPMVANMSLLEEAGVTELPTNWTEFKEACEAVTALGDNRYGWCINLATDVPNGIQNCVMAWLWASGGSMLTEDGLPNLEGNTEVAEVVDHVKSLFDAGVVTPGAYALDEATMVEEFANGRVAFIFDTLAHLNMIREASPDMEFQYMSVPVKDGYEGDKGMCVANWGIGISENCENKTEAMQFVEYLMSPEVNAKLAEAANAFPGNSTADPDYSSADPLFADAYEVYKTCYAANEFTGLPTAEELMRQFDIQLQLYLDGDTEDVNDMLAAAQAEWVTAFE